MTPLIVIPRRIRTEADARRVAASIGFTHFVALADGGSLVAAFRNPEGSVTERSGIYLLVRATGEVYVGQSVNVLNRAEQHRRAGHLRGVRWAAFLPCRPGRLVEREAELIDRAVRLGLPVLNREVQGAESLAVTGVVLDDVFPASLQDAFIGRAAERAAAGSPEGRLARLVASAPPSELDGWRRLREHPKARRILALAARIRRIALPGPQELLEAFDGFPPPECRCTADLAFNWWIVTTGLPGQSSEQPLLAITTGRRTLARFFHFSRLPGTVYVQLSLAAEAVSRGSAAERLRADLRGALWSGPGPEECLREPEALENPDWSPVQGRVYPGPAEREADLRREVTRAGMRESTRMTATLDFMEEALERPLVMRALALESLARMRHALVPKPGGHNRIAAAAIMSEEAAEVLLAADV